MVGSSVLGNRRASWISFPYFGCSHDLGHVLNCLSYLKLSLNRLLECSRDVLCIERPKSLSSIDPVMRKPLPLSHLLLEVPVTSDGWSSHNPLRRAILIQ